MADKTQMYSYEARGTMVREPMYDLLERLRLPLHEWFELKLYCDKIGIIMMATVNSFGGLDYAMALDLPVIKLSSWDYNFTDLWRECAKIMLPCIADLGAVTEAELTTNVDIFKAEKNDQLMFLHCSHSTTIKETNMNSLPFIADKYRCLTGYSSNDCNDDLDKVSIGLGACILEKRLTLDRTAGVLHDAVSKEPDEFEYYVDKMRALKTSMGLYGINQSRNDWLQRKKWFRRVVTDVPIAKGEDIVRELLECKRGETGFPPDRIYEIVGKKAKHDMPKNYDITLEDVE